MLTKNINFINFKEKKRVIGLKKILRSVLNENNQIIQSLRKNYKNSFKKSSLTFKKKIRIPNYRNGGINTWCSCHI